MKRDPIGLLKSSLARHGIWGTLALIPKNIAYAFDRRRNYTDREFDLKFGTDTSESLGLGGLTIASANIGASNPYQAIFRKRFEEVMNAIAIAHEDFVFIDVGSGKGKALLLASDFPFKRVIGIEFARELHEVAARNIEIYRNAGQRCRDVSSLCLDARDYEFPREPSLLLLNNPFGPPILGPLLANFRRSLQQAPRPAVVAYVNPVHGPFLEAELAGVLQPGVSTGELLLLATRDVKPAAR